MAAVVVESVAGVLLLPVLEQALSRVVSSGVVWLVVSVAVGRLAIQGRRIPSNPAIHNNLDILRNSR